MTTTKLPPIVSYRPGPYLMSVGPHIWRFKLDADTGSPTMMNKLGSVKHFSSYHERHPFWTHFRDWLTAGAKYAEEDHTGMCICVKFRSAGPLSSRFSHRGHQSAIVKEMT